MGIKYSLILTKDENFHISERELEDLHDIKDSLYIYLIDDEDKITEYPFNELMISSNN